MKLIFLILLSYGCAQVSKKKEFEPEVSVYTALNQAQMSYLKGCVEAFKTAKMSPSFPDCAHRAKLHREDLQEIMDSKIQEAL